MEIKLPRDVEQKLTTSIQRYLREELGEEVGALKAGQFLRYCMAEIAPVVYNLAIQDARAFVQEKAADLENTCFAQEGRYWDKPGTRTVSRKIR